MHTGREASLVKALTSPAGAVPLSLLTDLSPSQWGASFAFFLDAASVLFQSLSRLEFSDPHLVAKVEDSCENAVMEARRRVELCFACAKTLLKSVSTEKKVTLEIETLQTWVNRLVEVQSQSILNAEAWHSLRDLTLNGFSGVLVVLVKTAGEQLHTPAFFRTVATVCQQVSTSSASLSKLLCVALYRVGPLFAELAETYISKSLVCEKTLEALRAMANSTDVTLRVAKKMRSRKLGNSHQKRSQKNSMRRDEAKKLQEIERQVSGVTYSSMSQLELSANLRLLLAFVVTADCPALQSWLSLDWPRFDEETQSQWLELMLVSVLRSKKGVRQLERVLESAAETPALCSQSRHALFLLRQAEERPDAAPAVAAEETPLSLLDPDN